MSVYLPSYLIRNRHGIIYFRRVIPRDLQSIVGKREYQLSLKTREKRDAMNKARILAMQTDKWFKELRMNKKSYPRTEECKVKFETKLGIVTKEFSSDDIATFSKAGMSADEISNIINANPLATHPITVSTPTLQPAQLAKPKGIALSALIDRHKKDRIDKKGGQMANP